MGSETDMDTKPVEPMSGGPAGEPPMSVDPTDAEVEEWAARERARRQAWLGGPSPEEREAFARKERERRLAEVEGRPPRMWPGQRYARDTQRYARETQLAAEGAASLVTRWWRRTRAELVRAGREWEEELARPRPQRRIPLDDDAT
jgi:hypothetical protein